MKIIGITGGIATGKSTVTQMLRDKGFPVICADEISRDVVTPGKTAYQEAIKLFGPDILNPDQTLNRQKIAEAIFVSPELKKQLEDIIHPEVRKVVNEQIEQEKSKETKYLFLDIPLLFENHWEKICDTTICLFVPQDLQIARHQGRSGHTREHTLDRIHSQMPLAQKIKLADYSLYNDKTLEELKTNLEQILTKIVK